MNLYDQLFLADYKDLSLHECGRERCRPDKIVHMAIKDYHIFHYVLSGRGTLIYNDVTYNLKKGDIFYIAPEDTATYFPDKHDPWSYVWIGFEGARSDNYLKRLNINLKNPIFKDSRSFELRQLFVELNDSFMRAKYLNIESLSIFMNIIYKMTIIRSKDKEVLNAYETHIRNAKLFIENNFQFNITVNDIASSLGLSPNYLANIFKKVLESSPKQYLIQYRMLKASEFLIETDLSIKEISKMVGYNSPLHFSTEFKRVKKVSPLIYKTNNTF